MGRPVPPSDCNCHCVGDFVEPPIRYCCVNGQCFPCVGGPFSSPTCNGLCETWPPAKYNCINDYCYPDPDGPYTDPTCNNSCTNPTKYACNENGECVAAINGPYDDPSCDGFCPPTAKYSCVDNICVEDPDGIYSDPGCAEQCSTAPTKYSCNEETNQCIEDPNGPYTTSNCDGQCDEVEENCCEWDGTGATFTFQCPNGGIQFTWVMDCVKVTNYVWQCTSNTECGDSASATITCNPEVDVSDCESKWSVDNVSVPCVEITSLTMCTPCQCDVSPKWCFEGPSDCECCEVPPTACCCPDGTCVTISGDEECPPGCTAVPDVTCASFPYPCSDLDP